MTESSLRQPEAAQILHFEVCAVIMQYNSSFNSKQPSIPNIADLTLSVMHLLLVLLVLGVNVCAVLHEHAADISVFFSCGNDEGSVVAETGEHKITTSIPTIAYLTPSVMQKGLTPCSWR